MESIKFRNGHDKELDFDVEWSVQLDKYNPLVVTVPPLAMKLFVSPEKLSSVDKLQQVANIQSSNFKVHSPLNAKNDYPNFLVPADVVVIATDTKKTQIAENPLLIWKDVVKRYMTTKTLFYAYFVYDDHNNSTNTDTCIVNNILERMPPWRIEIDSNNTASSEDGFQLYDMQLVRLEDNPKTNQYTDATIALNCSLPFKIW